MEPKINMINEKSINFQQHQNVLLSHVNCGIDNPITTIIATLVHEIIKIKPFNSLKSHQLLCLAHSIKPEFFTFTLFWSSRAPEKRNNRVESFHACIRFNIPCQYANLSLIWQICQLYYHFLGGEEGGVKGSSKPKCCLLVLSSCQSETKPGFMAAPDTSWWLMMSAATASNSSSDVDCLLTSADIFIQSSISSTSKSLSWRGTFK